MAKKALVSRGDMYFQVVKCKGDEEDVFVITTGQFGKIPAVYTMNEGELVEFAHQLESLASKRGDDNG